MCSFEFPIRLRYEQCEDPLRDLAELWALFIMLVLQSQGGYCGKRPTDGNSESVEIAYALGLESPCGRSKDGDGRNGQEERNGVGEEHGCGLRMCSWL